MSESLPGIRQHQHPPIKILNIASKNELNQNPKITKRYTYRKAKNEQLKTGNIRVLLIIIFYFGIFIGIIVYSASKINVGNRMDTKIPNGYGFHGNCTQTDLFGDQEVVLVVDLAVLHWSHALFLDQLLHFLFVGF